MCGLVGVVSKAYNGFTNKERDVFNELLFIDTVRGDDSTGVMMVDNDGNLSIAKEASSAEYFQRAPEYVELVQKAYGKGSAMIGHNRKATRGVINDENAHPFVVDNRISLVHNGTLYGDHKKIADVEVDSHAIAHLIHQHEDDVEKAMQEIQGAYALIWYDVKNRSMNFLRNSQRPLYYVETHQSWFFASEAGMLAWMLARHDITAINGGIKALPEATLMTFTRDKRAWVQTEKKIVLSKAPPPTTTVFRTSYDYRDRTNDSVYSRVANARHPYATAWGDDDAFTLDTDDRLVSVPPVERIAAPSHTEGVVRVKALAHEAERADREAIAITSETFFKVAEGYKPGTWVTAVPFDYEYVNASSANAGILIYAKVVDNEDILIRCYSPFEPGDRWEREIVSICTGEDKYAFKAMHRSWTSYQDPTRPMYGYGMVFSKEYHKVQEVNHLREVIDAQV